MRDYAAFEIPQLSVAAPAWSEMRHIVLYFGGARAVTDLERESLISPFKTALEAGWRPSRRRTKDEPDGNELGEGHGAEQGPLADGRGRGRGGSDSPAPAALHPLVYASAPAADDAVPVPPVRRHD